MIVPTRRRSVRIAPSPRRFRGLTSHKASCGRIRPCGQDSETEGKCFFRRCDGRNSQFGERSYESKTYPGQRASAREARKCSVRSSAIFRVMPFTAMRSFGLAFAKSSAFWKPASIRAFARVFPIPLIRTRSWKMSGWAVFAASSSRLRLWLPAPPVGDRVADERVHVARLDLQDVVEQVQGLRVVPARARDERAAQQARHVDTDLLDLLSEVVVLRVDGRGFFVRGEGLGPSSEVRERVPFHLEGGRFVGPQPEQLAHRLEALAPAAFVGVESDEGPERG